MILATLLAAALPAQEVTPGQLVSKMFAYYSGATSMSGRIKMSQSIQNRVAVIDTTFQYENPAKIYINQVLTAPYGSDQWLITGDGVGFSYPPPRNDTDTRVRNRLYEPVQFIPPPPINKTDAPQLPGPPLSLGQIYSIVAKTLGDRSLPIDVAFGRKEDLNFIRQQIMSIKYQGPDAGCSVLTGKWRDIQTVDTSGKVLPMDNGTFSIWITSEGELKRFERHEMIDLKQQGVRGEIVTVWQVEIKKNAIIDPKLFTVVLK